MGRYRNSGIGKGIGTSPQLSLENQEYENKVKEIEEGLETKKENKDKTNIKIDIETINEDNFPFEVSENKYDKYLFVLDHEVGGTKAVFLKDVLGYTIGDGKKLHYAILNAIKGIKPNVIEQTEFGIKYKFKTKIKCNNEFCCDANVVVVVQKDNGKIVWRIITVFPGKKER